MEVFITFAKHSGMKLNSDTHVFKGAYESFIINGKSMDYEIREMMLLHVAIPAKSGIKNHFSFFVS